MGGVTLIVLEKIVNFIDSEVKLLGHSSEILTQSSENEIHFFQIRAAQKLGYTEPFTYDQTAMNNILKYNGASRELIEKTWAFYHNAVKA